MLNELDALLPWLNDQTDLDLRKLRAFLRSFAGTTEAGGLHYDRNAEWEQWQPPRPRGVPPMDWDTTQVLLRSVLCPGSVPGFPVWIPVTVFVGPDGGISGPLPDVLLFFAMRLPPALVGHCQWCDRLFPRRRGRGQPRKDACSAACKQALFRASRIG